MKTMNHPHAKAMCVNAEECAALDAVEELLSEIQFAFGGETTIVSLETGEAITPGELARVRGILSFIRQYRVVEVN